VSLAYSLPSSVASSGGGGEKQAGFSQDSSNSAKSTTSVSGNAQEGVYYLHRPASLFSSPMRILIFFSSLQFSQHSHHYRMYVWHFQK
jgi:hypothetical protein